MRVKLKNIADFDLGEFTIICGQNNTGKTHAVRALSGLFPNAVIVDQAVALSLERTSFIAKEHPDIMNDFGDIIGGEYVVDSNGELYFVPKGKMVRLSMVESSGAVRALLNIGCYIRHTAKKDDLLIMEEPESNLHPENQCRIARLLARLVNSGIKVLITTHSDYIVRELNTLVMLNADKPHLKKIAREEGYKENELISADKIKVYVAEKDNTLTPAPLDPEFGMEVRSFDTIIDRMNRIQDDIVWGG
jgi:energy-coupling factor transporter ATP-binding protein EcfA2